MTNIFLVNVKYQSDGKPLQASTTNAFLRRFLSHVKARYNVSMSLEEDFNFPGGITGQLLLYSKYYSHQCSLHNPYPNSNPTYNPTPYFPLGCLKQLYLLRASCDQTYGIGQNKQALSTNDYN